MAVSHGQLEVQVTDILQVKYKMKYGAGYALKDVAVYYIMRTNPEVFRRLGRSWDDDENSYCHVSCQAQPKPQLQLD